MSLNILKLLCFIYYLTKSVSTLESECNCGGSDSFSLNKESSKLIPSDEIIHGVNYSIPVAVGNIQVLIKDFILQSSVRSLSTNCPRGYRPPYIEELRTIFKTNSVEFLKNNLKINPDVNYLSTNKSSLSENETLDEAWEFKGFYLSNETVVEDDLSSFPGRKDVLTFTRCISDIKQITPLRIYQKDFVIGVNYEVSLINKNYLAFAFRAENKTISESIFNLTFDNHGCHTLEFFALNLAGQKIYNCRQIYVTFSLGSDSETKIYPNSIESIPTGIKASRTIYQFWNSGNAPIAPILETGGFYIAFTGIDNFTYVCEYDSNMRKIKEVNVNMHSYVMDISSNEEGFTLFLKDLDDINHAYLIGFNKEFNMKYNRLIMNNGYSPKSIMEQISFYDKKGNLLNGLNAMFSAFSGKLAFGKDRIGLIFSHKSNLGNSVKPKYRIADTFISFDKYGLNETIAWSWKTSNSLYQAQIYDGQYFITASLGDYSPSNIEVCVINSNHVTDDLDEVRKSHVFNNFKCKNIVPGNIPGDGKGNSCGKIGGLAKKGSTYALVYSRKTCFIVNTNKGVLSNKEDEIGLITFNINFKGKIKNITKFKLGEATTLTGIRSAKYGKNIFITYVKRKANFGLISPANFINGDEMLETQYAMLVDFNGKVITPEFEYKGHINLSPSDDMRILNDGRVVWANIDRKNQLFINYLPTPNFNEREIDNQPKEESIIKNNNPFIPDTSKEELIFPLPSSSIRKKRFLKNFT